MATTWKYGGYCACGCGQKTQRAPADHKTYGWKKGEPYEYVSQHHNNKKRSNYVEEDRGFEPPCHIWQGQPSQRYPSIKIKGKPKKLHSWAWEKTFGPIPDGFVVHHRCDQPRCCNPQHLELVTQAVNSQRGRSSRLTMEKANQIRALYATGDYSYRQLGAMYEVSLTTVQNVVYGHTWKPAELHRPAKPPRRQDD